MSALGRDLRFSLRMLGKNPGFMLAAIITLALGIGANTAIFTVTSALLLRPFPYRDPQQLVNITVKSADRDHGGTLNRYDLLRDHVRSLEGIAA
jgi:putative ABC transport system permease protein